MMPLVASFGGYLLLGSPFSWLEILLSIVSLFGVFLVASPDVVLSGNASQMDPRVDESKVVSLTMRVWAICVGLLGVCGSAAAFLCMSAIGKSERPLTVVNFFATLCTLFSCFGLLVVPGLKFEMPGDAWEWILLALSGISGFLMVRSSDFADLRFRQLTCGYSSNFSLPCLFKQQSPLWQSTWSIPRLLSP